MSRISDWLLHRFGIQTALLAAAHGGFEVMSPTPASEHDVVHFRTLIELDGDIVTVVHETHRDDLEGLRHHFRAVHEVLAEILVGIRRIVGTVASGAGVGVALAGVLVFSGDGVALSEGVASTIAGAGTALATRVSRRFRSWLLRHSLAWVTRGVIERSFGTTQLETLQSMPHWNTSRMF